MNNLQIHFIWCGSDCSKIIENLLIPKIISLKYFFKNSGYHLSFNLWLDRPISNATISNMNYKLNETINVRDIFNLFSEIENDINLNIYDKNKRFLRYLFSDESGTISTYNKSTDFPNTSKLSNYYKPMPAIAADIIKAILGYKNPGLYIDIGLDVSKSGVNENLSNILQSNHRFKNEVFFAATKRQKEGIDYQIMYSTSDKRCQSIYKKVIEEYYKVGNLATLSGEITHKSTDMQFRSYFLHSYNYGSTTGEIWDSVMKNRRIKKLIYDIYDNFFDLNKHCYIPLSSMKGSIGNFIFKNREKSPFDDYKNIKENKIIDKYSKNLKLI